eukprot:TRINITY_DN67768_c10_g8_i1.p1 TRINITY_DN67768_c10_g8~~TRINITY_DN67768_c10_g8_i1.p1  ORF type:complete len:648 (+),score=34.91 TRINITY_DN67768_c10_g8_i1:39-1982(+)
MSQRSVFAQFHAQQTDNSQTGDTAELHVMECDSVIDSPRNVTHDTDNDPPPHVPEDPHQHQLARPTPIAEPNLGMTEMVVHHMEDNTSTATSEKEGEQNTAAPMMEQLSTETGSACSSTPGPDNKDNESPAATPSGVKFGDVSFSDGSTFKDNRRRSSAKFGKEGSSMYKMRRRQSYVAGMDPVQLYVKPSVCQQALQAFAYLFHLGLFSFRFGFIMCLTVTIVYLIPFTPKDNPDFSCDNPDYFNFWLTMCYSCIAVGTVAVITITAATVELFPEAKEGSVKWWFLGTTLISTAFMWVSYIAMAFAMDKGLYFNQGQLVGSVVLIIDTTIFAIVLWKKAGISRTWLYSIQFLVMVSVVTLYGTTVVPIYLKTDNVIVKSAIRLVFVPFMDKLMMMLTKFLLKKYQPARQITRAYSWVFMWTAYSTFFARFMMTASSSFSLTIVLVVVTSLMELFMITSMKWQLRFLPDRFKPAVDEWVMLTNYTLALELTHTITTNVAFFLLSRHHLLLDFGYSAFITPIEGVERTITTASGSSVTGIASTYEVPSAFHLAWNSALQFCSEVFVIFFAGWIGPHFLRIDLLGAWKDRNKMWVVEISLAVLVVVLSMNVYLIVPLSSTCATYESLCDCNFPFHRCHEQDPFTCPTPP